MSGLMGRTEIRAGGLVYRRKVNRKTADGIKSKLQAKVKAGEEAAKGVRTRVPVDASKKKGVPGVKDGG